MEQLAYTKNDIPYLEKLVEHYAGEHVKALKEIQEAKSCVEKNEAKINSAVVIKNHNTVIELIQEIKKRSNTF